jgi:hypothetical protein
MVVEDYMIVGFSFLLAAICALANLVAKEFKNQKIVSNARAQRLYQLEIEMWEVKRMIEKGTKK